MAVSSEKSVGVAYSDLSKVFQTYLKKHGVYRPPHGVWLVGTFIAPQIVTTRIATVLNILYIFQCCIS